MGILNGKSAIITGGGSGIGRAISEQFIKDGCSVIITGRNLDKLKRTSEELSEFGNIDYRILDITDFNHMPEFFSSLHPAFSET